jgi:hypothetical protein
MQTNKWLCETCFRALCEYYLIMHEVLTMHKFPVRCDSCGKFEYMDKFSISEEEFDYLKAIVQ